MCAQPQRDMLLGGGALHTRLCAVRGRMTALHVAKLRPFEDCKVVLVPCVALAIGCTEMGNIYSERNFLTV